jgi:hypothetical protein
VHFTEDSLLTCNNLCSDGDREPRFAMISTSVCPYPQAEFSRALAK